MTPCGHALQQVSNDAKLAWKVAPGGYLAGSRYRTLPDPEPCKSKPQLSALLQGRLSALQLPLLILLLPALPAWWLLACGAATQSVDTPLSLLRHPQLHHTAKCICSLAAPNASHVTAGYAASRPRGDDSAWQTT